MKNFFLFLIIFLFSLPMYAQTQVVRGKILDTQSKFPLIGATVIVIGSDPLMGATTDADGFFTIPAVPVGRINLKVSYVGYNERIIPNVIVTAGKEVFITTSLEEQLLDAVEIVAEDSEDKTKPINEFSSVSTRQFTIEETSRYAGSRNDPARMATNFAGVSGANDARNDIIIRGNSPTGLLWRLDGIDIPSPNHFSTLGATGGPVSMLNNNTLNNSDFTTGAFPAEYGNALAGVFDLQMRTGNAFKREYMAQIGFNGFEAGLEGPFSKNSRASYLVNYRYSTLAVFDAMGIDLGTGNAIPYYQDINFKFDFPTQKWGRFSLFGFGGISNIDLLGSEEDVESENQFSSSNEDLRAESLTGSIGLTHNYYFNKNTYSQFNIAFSGTNDSFMVDQLERDASSGEVMNSFYSNGGDYQQTKWSFREQINSKLNSKNTVNGGVIVDVYNIDIIDSVLTEDGSFLVEQDFEGNTTLVQPYVQWQHRFTEQLTMNAGVHGQWLALNDSWAIEPRLGFRYNFRPNQTLSLGLGMHSQIQPLSVYFLQNEQGERTNENLDFTRANHVVLGYENQLGDNLRLKTEVYYQQLYDAPVESQPSSFSLLNTGTDFGIDSRDNLVNEGEGRNYGVELTLERFYSDDYYFLFTTSLFRSEYQGSDEVWRNTAFDGNYVMNGLFGREWRLGKKNNALTMDIKATAAGGRRFTPIDLAATSQITVIDEDDVVFDEENAFSEQLNDYFRLDFKIGYRMNGQRITQEFFVDIQNITNRQNPLNVSYNRATQQLRTNYQLGLFPVVQYRVTF
ncbi:MAG: TonB-dependent receptor [Bacteroidota bacterium]